MNRLHLLAGQLVQVEWDTDESGVVSADPILPPIKEVAFGGLATLIVFVALWKFAGPAVRKALRDRTERIQADLDGAAAATVDADSSATEIRAVLGDIDGERQRIFAEADLQADAILADGRRRLDDEIAELHARADGDISTAAGRTGDELRGDIGRHAAAGLEAVVTRTLDDATQQELIESFIQRVGASTTGAATS
jgi:F-type H+-transporting ATPase subunit b